MKLIRYLTVLGGLAILAFAFGFIFQIHTAISLWPWPDSRLSYIFVGSIMAAVSAAAIWIGWAGEFGALPAGALNIFVIAITSAIYFLQLAVQGNRPNLFPYGLLSMLIALASGISFFWSRRIPLRVSHPTPVPVRVSFGIFLGALVLAGGALVLRIPIFPWAVNPDSSVIFGCIFIGDAFYFLYALLAASWHNAKGQLLSFLAYDLVLIFPFLALFGTVKPEFKLSLIVYIAVLVYSGAVAIYYLFFNSQTRA
jgi:hypothetical protein